MQGREFLSWLMEVQLAPLVPRLGKLWGAVKEDELSFREVPLFDPSRPPLSCAYMDKYAFYFAPNCFDGRRQKHNFLATRVLYQDLDEVRPDECPLLPDVWWETSPDRYQAIWVLESPITVLRTFEELNRGLNRACEADKGTWNTTRLLRVPGSYNGKRDCRVGPAYLTDRELASAA